ncbi:MAG TPA: type II secretion system inner membrane protein GspF [Candidatus Binatus sp.]|nr:type II secretion system inner membrane protein GspF [Candidatus Binatus sp.]
MPVFAYRALTVGGRTRGGVIDAETPRAAWQELRTRGFYPTDLQQQTVGQTVGQTPGATWTARRLGTAELAAATRQLATLVEAGVPVAEALGAVAEQADHPALVRALTLARARLHEGESLADALAASPRVFPELFRDLVRAGEASGAIATVLVRLADHIEASAAVRARLRAALTYPAVMTAATAAVLAFLLAWVVPQLTELFRDAGAELPVATRMLIALTSGVGRLWWAVLAGGAAAAWGARRSAASPAGRAWLDATVLRVPLLGRLLAKAAVARLARTLATLLAGGVPLEAALGIAGAAAGNRPIADAIAAAREAVRQGEPLAPALRRSALLPPLLVRLTAAGERSGTLGDMLERAATACERDVEAGVAALTALVEPVLVLVMGGVVLALVAAVLLPLFDLNGLVR